jgi:hypothetical protein
VGAECAIDPRLKVPTQGLEETRSIERLRVRIERLWGTFQDRLVSELRLAKTKTMEQAQAVLDRYLSEHNRKFSKPAKAQPARRNASPQQIEQALCFKDKRTVANDNTVTFAGVIFQIPKKSSHRSYANKRIDVHVGLDGSVECFYKKKKSPPLTPKRRTHWAYIERTRNGRDSAMDPFPIYQPITTNSHPDIFSLLLT